jgi:hypothetical protein
MWDFSCFFIYTQVTDLPLDIKPNLLSEDGTVALATAAFSRGSGEYYAYGISLSVRDHLELFHS